MILATLAQIVEAANAAEGQYDPKSCRQVTSIRQVASFGDDDIATARYYVVAGKTFRSVTAFEWCYAVEVTKDGIACHSESDLRNAEVACYMLMDARRATPSVEGV